MFSIWCEWDIGQEGVVFKSKEEANKWLLGNYSLPECFEDGLSGQEGIDNLIDAGLLSIEKQNVYGE